MNKLLIRGPRQQRAISALLEGPVTVKDIDQKSELLIRDKSFQNYVGKDLKKLD